MTHKLKVIFVFAAALIMAYTNSYAQMKIIKEFEDNEKHDRSISGMVARPVIKYVPTGARDPFVSLIKKDPHEGTAVVSAEIQVVPPSLTVQGIIWGGAVPQAIIDNQVVRVGDTLKNARITAIAPQGITFVYMEHVFNLAAPSHPAVHKEKSQGG